MLYNMDGGHFSHMLDELQKLGVSEENLAAAAEYLDPEKPRNDALLDRITMQESSWTRGYYTTKEMQNAIKRELLPLQSRDLTGRFLLCTYAIAGSYCARLGGEPFALDMQDGGFEPLFLEVIGERYGASAQPRVYACRIANFAQYGSCSTLGGSAPVESPEICLAAMDYIPNTNGKLQMILYTLDGCSVPEEKKGLKALFAKPDANTQEALRRLKEILGSVTPEWTVRELYLLLYASASLFEPAYRDLMMQQLQQMGADALQQGARAVIYYFRGLRNKDRLLFVFDGVGNVTADYILTYVEHHSGIDERLPNADAHLDLLSVRHPERFREVMYSVEHYPLKTCKKLETIYCRNHPEYDPGTTLRDNARIAILYEFAKTRPGSETQIELYLHRRISIDEFKGSAKYYKCLHYWAYHSVRYAEVFGMDDFAKRCVCFQAMVNYNADSHLLSIPGIKLHSPEQQKEVIALLREERIPLHFILRFCGNLTPAVDKSDKDNYRNPIMESLLPFADEIKDCDKSILEAEGRILAIRLLHAKGWTNQLFDFCEEGSKAVREVLYDLLPKPSADSEFYYARLLNKGKKNAREVAVSMLEREFPDCLMPDVQKAYEMEKNAALKTRLAALLGMDAPADAKEKTESDLIASLTKASKLKKVDWLFANDFAPVRHADTMEPADVNLLKALCIAYADQGFGLSRLADQIAAMLFERDLESFAGEVLNRWISQGANTKQKWVLCLASVHGGTDMLTALKSQIKDWTEHARGAIAAEAVQAIALNGSSAALMTVDEMARKAKNKQVRRAAGTALQSAADALSITREELQDRIVPDLGFDKNLCRVFDFGERQFQVYLTPALELEIFEGDKKLKNLPKPGVKDDPDKSAQAVRDFKDMKKLMKATVTAQRQRLEYVLLCDRKWDEAGWRALFIEKPVMHCFAIGLIWGVYENGALVQSFRYMEDGSFNTPDEDEYTLPAGAQIGLVHPLELDAETLQQWQEQLSDYEITQPFDQLSRPVYRIEENERGEKALTRFKGRQLSDMTLLSRMTKYGWDKGPAEDAGMFYCFTRQDVERQETLQDGSVKRHGCFTVLRFEGMYIGGFDGAAEDTTVQEVQFYPIGATVYSDTNPLTLGELSPRYFSEIVSQLEAALTRVTRQEESE